MSERLLEWTFKGAGQPTHDMRYGGKNMKKTAVKLKHTDFNMKEHGFVGHLAEPKLRQGTGFSLKTVLTI